ncbi:hypothetical protein SEA_TELAVIV_13 [Mycobacterium phage TelAviv]|uniref:Uncharacterized protein n=6 Tax=Viruses TaxID=10239 RepID=Q856S8_BPMCO|nr:gp16 [Mycobacterium phage Corndog]YP_008409182.1 hypothetical protein PBI_CATDAWG_13 [Mycobacterium phage Catdawg]YP_008530578.1 hypothetical protein PBI_DYLAN_14 [Mycobacterium phage Dylan]AII28254.1 hypothetical protein PBI_YUNGJAMAL_15 [Mycobacterium phage YungJamal]ALA48858.1 hypothetical protein ZAKHE101_15 [Mycobacterium phage Zakhe101]ATW60496.1 hypothetical protein SEA_FAMILTON_14 [Mycobacterium phage Familton]AVI04044.1 hypothetical protein SEA_JANGDYNASTY_13 [Mycobacterium phage 
MMMRDRIVVIEELSTAFVSLLKAQSALAFDNTLDEACIEVRDKLIHHLNQV